MPNFNDFDTGFVESLGGFGDNFWRKLMFNGMISVTQGDIYKLDFGH